MRETVNFRVFAEHLTKFDIIPTGIGTPVGDDMLDVEVEPSALLFKQIGSAQAALKAERDLFYSWWKYRRRYTQKELAAAELFHLELVGGAYFEPAGEECGTTYDESTACPHCGVGRTQISDLALDLRKVPKGKDFVKTIADEWLISDRLARRIEELGLKGFEFRPVHHFKKSRTPLPAWHQLVIPPPEERVPVLPPTRFGIGPFDDDPAGEYRCPSGHVLGLNILSELYVERAAWERLGRDIAFTREMAGRKAGLLRPEPFILISPRFYRLLKEAGVKALGFEVAHLDERQSYAGSHVPPTDSQASCGPPAKSASY